MASSGRDWLLVILGKAFEDHADLRKVWAVLPFGGPALFQKSFDVGSMGKRSQRRAMSTKDNGLLEILYIVHLVVEMLQGAELPQNNSKGIYIRSCGCELFQHGLWGHVAERSSHSFVDEGPVFARRNWNFPGQSEIKEDRVAFSIETDILWLQISELCKVRFVR